MKLLGKIKKYFLRNCFITRELIIWYVRRVVRPKSDEIVLISPYPLGETYLFCSLLDSFKLKYNVQSVVFISDRKYHSGIFEMYDNGIDRYYIFPHLSEQSFRGFTEIKKGTFYMIRGDRELNENFLSHLKKGVGVDMNSKVRHHQIKDEHKAKAKDLFDMLGLTQNKTVFLSPEASSHKQLDKSFCTEISDRLKGKGYDVFLNITCADNMIPSVKSAFLPLFIATPFSDLCGHVIAIRSGLCDLISGSMTNFHIIYWDKEFQQKFSLKDIVVSKCINEYVVGELSEKEVIDSIIGNMDTILPLP
jgi:hypothetical protein